MNIHVIKKMKMKSYPLSYRYACFIGSGGNGLQAQIFTAKEGSFVVFHDTPLKDAAVTLSDVGTGREKYEWPKNENEVIQEYRIAEKIFVGPMNLTDEDLHKMWVQLENMNTFAPSFQFSPTLLLALGQDLLPVRKTGYCSISIRSDKETETKS